MNIRFVLLLERQHRGETKLEMCNMSWSTHSFHMCSSHPDTQNSHSSARVDTVHKEKNIITLFTSVIVIRKSIFLTMILIYIYFLWLTLFMSVF